MAVSGGLRAEGARGDEAARRRIGPWQQEGQPDLSSFAPDTTFVVCAAAGSGKTTALVARMVALVREGVPIEDMAAITFTRKAAGEMNERLFEELRRARAELRENREEQARVREALARLPRCFIGTVHAFCARILRGHALAAGLPPRFRAGAQPACDAIKAARSSPMTCAQAGTTRGRTPLPFQYHPSIDCNGRITMTR